MFAYDSHATAGQHVSAPPGTLIANRYQVVREAGTGNFARVFECINTSTGTRVAVKLLKKGFERDADFEEEILRAVNATDPTDQQGLVKLVERGEWNRHAMLVFTLKGEPLRNLRLPVLSKEKLYGCIRDVAESLAFLHYTVKAVHTDLKPENILAELPNNNNNNNSGGGGGGGIDCRQWCVCDFGSASFFTPGKLDTDLITTRPYRAPEVVLSRGWSAAADAWSLGCVMYELRTGRKLFDCQSDADHLDLIIRRLGPVPAGMQTGRYNSFIAATKGLGGGANSCGRMTSNSSASLQMIKDEFRDDPTFASILLSLLAIDPNSRSRCDDVARKLRSVLEEERSQREASSSLPSRAALTSISDVFRNSTATASSSSIKLSLGANPCGGSSSLSSIPVEPVRGSFSGGNSAATPRMSPASSALDIENMMNSKCFIGKIGGSQQQQPLISPAPLSNQQQKQGGNHYASTYRVAYI